MLLQAIFCNGTNLIMEGINVGANNITAVTYTASSYAYGFQGWGSIWDPSGGRHANHTRFADIACSRLQAAGSHATTGLDAAPGVPCSRLAVGLRLRLPLLRV